MSFVAAVRIVMQMKNVVWPPGAGMVTNMRRADESRGRMT